MFIIRKGWWVIIAGLTGLLTACGGFIGGPGPTPTPLPPVVSYEKAIFTVKKGEIVQEKEMQAVVVPYKQDDLYFQSSGFITRVLVKEGDPVKKGDLLAELQVDDLLNQLEQAQIDLEVAQAALAKDKTQREYAVQRAQIDVKMWEDRLELAKLDLADAPGGSARNRAQLNYDITEQNLELAKIDLKEANEQVTSYEEQAVQRSQLAVQRLESLVAEKRIYAPYDGLVLKTNGVEGREIQAYDIAIRIGDPAELVLRTPYDYDISKVLSNNTDIRVQIFTDTEEKLTYPVEYLPNFIPITNSEGSGSSSSASDWFYFTIPQGLSLDKLPIGHSVNLVVTIGKKEDALLLPPAAIRSYGGNSFVIILDGDRRRWVEISSIGLRTSEYVEVVADLAEGDQVLGP